MSNYKMSETELLARYSSRTGRLGIVYTVGREQIHKSPAKLLPRVRNVQQSRVNNVTGPLHGLADGTRSLLGPESSGPISTARGVLPRSPICHSSVFYLYGLYHVSE